MSLHHASGAPMPSGRTGSVRGIELEPIGSELEPPPLIFVPYNVDGGAALRWRLIGARHLRRTWPRWVSAVAASAVIVGSGSAYVASAEPTPQLTAAQRAAFVGQCESGAGWTAGGCECLLTQLTANGYNTPSSVSRFMSDARQESVSGRSGLASRTLAQAAQTCLGVASYN